MNESKVCMCIHGAGQAVTNPLVRAEFGFLPLQDFKMSAQLVEVRKLLNTTWHRKTYFDHLHGDARDVYSMVNPISPAMIGNDGCDIRSVYRFAFDAWEARPYNVQKITRYGSLELHYLMGMFGLTGEFNDDPDTKLEMIHDRLDEAIAWCRTNNL